MKVYFKNGLSADFPMTAFKLYDLIDKLGIPHDEPAADFHISAHDNFDFPYCLCKSYRADIYMLNLFADRYKDLDEDDRSKLISIIKTHPDSTIDDMVCMTFGLDSVPDFPCPDFETLGEFVIDNDILPEINSCPDEIIPYLDKDMLGRMLADREEGVLMDERYFVTSEYEKPELNITISHEVNSAFNLLLAPSENKTEQAMWLVLPCEKKKLDDFKKMFSTNIEDMICCDSESLLPNLEITSTKDIEKLNTLAEKVSKLSHSDLIKLKAVMENENIYDIKGVNNAISALNEYEFDASVHDENTFGSEYLVRNLPTNFDHSTLDDVDLSGFGQAVLDKSGGGITSYGAVSARGVGLYSVLTDDMELENDEEFDTGMEMSL